MSRRGARIGVINLMPQAETYMPVLKAVFPDDTELVWIRIKNHPYKSSNQEVLSATHTTYEKAIASGLDGVYLTGAPVDGMKYGEEHYWNELAGMVEHAASRVGSLFGICWGALAIAKILFGLEKEFFPQKLYGIFESRLVDSAHVLADGFDDVFWCPQSRYSRIDERALEASVARGEMRCIDHSDEPGHSLLASPDGRIVLCQGHLDYPTQRLQMEYERDCRLRRPPPAPPKNYDIVRPRNTWRAHGKLLFRAWAHRCVAVRE